MKTLTRLMIAVATLPTLALAQYAGPHATPQITSVAAARSASDDVPVVLDGRILRKNSEKHYDFADAAGDVIQVKISDRRFPAEKVDEKTKVRIYGEVEKKLFQDATIEVKQLEIIR